MSQEVEKKVVSTGYSPRQWQEHCHKNMRRFSVLNIHRRGGKSVMCINHMINDLIKEPNKNPFGGFIAQNYQSAKKIIWEYLKDYTAVFPNVKVNESELMVTIPRPWKTEFSERGDKIRIQLFGSERPDSMRGLYFDFAVLDEYGFSDPTAWAKIIRPALSDREGKAILISTPNGRNHFKEAYDFAEKKMNEGNPNWFAYTLRASESGIIPKDELQTMYDAMDRSDYEAEYECSFWAQVKGSYYKEIIERLRADKKITQFSHDPALPVYVSMDLGMSDSTSLWFAQVSAGEPRFLKYYENNGKGLDHYVKVIKDTGWLVEELIVPHDANVKDLTSGKTRVQTLRELGIPRVRLLSRTSVQEGIEATRMLLSKAWFNEPGCSYGIECLTGYHKEWNEKMRVFMNTPKHDWASHCADSMRYMAMGLDIKRATMGRNYGRDLPRQSEGYYDIFSA